MNTYNWDPETVYNAPLGKRAFVYEVAQRRRDAEAKEIARAKRKGGKNR